MSKQKNSNEEKPFAPYQLFVDQNTPINAENIQISGDSVQHELNDINRQYMQVVSYPDFKPDVINNNNGVAIKPSEPGEGQTSEHVGADNSGENLIGKPSSQESIPTAEAELPSRAPADTILKRNWLRRFLARLNPLKFFKKNKNTASNTTVEISAGEESACEANQSVNNTESDAQPTVQPPQDNSVFQVTTAMSGVEDTSITPHSTNTNLTEFEPYTFPQGIRGNQDSSIDLNAITNDAQPPFDNDLIHRNSASKTLGTDSNDEKNVVSHELPLIPPSNNSPSSDSNTVAPATSPEIKKGNWLSRMWGKIKNSFNKPNIEETIGRKFYSGQLPIFITNLPANNQVPFSNASSNNEAVVQSVVTTPEDRNATLLEKIQNGISDEEVKNHREWVSDHPGLMNLDHGMNNASNPEQKSLLSKAASWLKRQIGAFHRNDSGSFSFFGSIAEWEKKKAQDPELQTWVDTPAKLITSGVVASYGLQSIIGLSAIQNALYVGGITAALPMIAVASAVPVLAGVAAYKIGKYRYDSAKLRNIAGALNLKNEMTILSTIRSEIAADKKKELNEDEKKLLNALDCLWKDSHAEKTTTLGRNGNATYCLLNLWNILKDGKSVEACIGKPEYKILNELQQKLPPPTTPTTLNEQQKAALNTLRRIAISYEPQLHTGKLSSLATGAGIGALYALSSITGVLPVTAIGVGLLAAHRMRRNKKDVVMGPRGYVVGNNGNNVSAAPAEIMQAKRFVNEAHLKKYIDDESYATHAKKEQIKAVAEKLRDAIPAKNIPIIVRNDKKRLAEVLSTYMTNDFLALGKPKLGQEDNENMKNMKEKIEGLKEKITQAKIDQTVGVEMSEINRIEKEILNNTSEIQCLKSNSTNGNNEAIANYVAQNTALQDKLAKYKENNNDVSKAKKTQELAEEEIIKIQVKIKKLQENATTETASGEVASIALAVVTNEIFDKTPVGYIKKKVNMILAARKN